MRRFSETLLKSLHNYHPISTNLTLDPHGLDLSLNDAPLSPAESAAIDSTNASALVSPISPIRSRSLSLSTSSPVSPVSPHAGQATLLAPEARHWRDYARVHPRPARAFFDLVYTFHCNHGTGNFVLAHDVGTGPGIIAADLAAEFDRVVASDVNREALAAVRGIVRRERQESITWVRCAAEELAAAPEVKRAGAADMVVAAQCIELMDVRAALESFARVLKPGGTVAVWYYGRPIFRGWAGVERCEVAFERLATELCRRCQQGEEVRCSVSLVTDWLEGVQFPTDTWRDVERHKWNSDHPMLLNDPDAFDFPAVNTSWSRLEEEMRIDHGNANVWPTMWHVDDVLRFLETYYPCRHLLRGQADEVANKLVKEFRHAFGGEEVKRAVHWPIVLLLAVKR